MFKVLVLSLFIFSPLLGQQALAEIDFRTVKQSAELSSASYGNPEELKQSLQTTGYKVIHHAELPASAVSYYLAQSATGMQQLAFRGTANLENVLVDLDVSLLPDSTLGVQLHQGFSLAAKAVYNDVLTHIDDDGQLVDVRSPQEYTGEKLHMPDYPQEGAMRGGHIPGARNIPWSRAANADGTFKNADDLRAIYETEQNLDPAADTITYCRIGERSSHSWFVLKYLLGYPSVVNYDGSWTEWGNLVNVPIEK